MEAPIKADAALHRRQVKNALAMEASNVDAGQLSRRREDVVDVKVSLRVLQHLLTQSSSKLIKKTAS